MECNGYCAIIPNCCLCCVRAVTACFLPCVLQTTYYVALFLLPLGDAVTINLIGPPVTAIFARLLLKEPLG